MELVKAPGTRRNGFVRRDALSQLCEVGDRLDYILARYTRLVKELGDSAVGVPDLSGRVELINSQLVYVAQRLQEMFVLEHEAARADRLAEESSQAGRDAFRRPPVRALA